MTSRVHYAIRTSNWAVGLPYQLAAVSGVLNARLRADGELVLYFDRGDGELVGLIWPEGYFALLDPVEVYDSHGRLVARVGIGSEWAGVESEMTFPNQKVGQGGGGRYRATSK